MISQRILIIGMIIALAVVTALAAEVPGVQGCVGAGCDSPVNVPGIQGCVGMGCLPCDEKLLKELKAKYEQKIKAYRDIVAAAEETRQREGEAIDEAKDIFGDYTKDIAKEGATTVAKNKYPVPTEVYAKFQKYKQMTGDVSSTEDVLKLAKLYLEELAKNSGYKDAVERAKWVNTVISGIAMDAKILTKLKEADFISEQAFNQWLRGYESLTEARHLADRIRKLEAQCKTHSASHQDESPPEYDFKSSGERELDEAKKLMDSWEKVEGGFVDAEGKYHTAETALTEARDILQGLDSLWQTMDPSTGMLSVALHVTRVSEQSSADYQQEWIQFKQSMIRAFQYEIKALEDFIRAEAAFHQIPKQ